MNYLFRYAAVLFLSVLFMPAAFAVTLQEAKSEGLVGEQHDGYVGFVVSEVPATVAELVTRVNAERRQRYEQIAEENGIDIEQVQALAYQQAVEATQPGHYLQNASGTWVRK